MFARVIMPGTPGAASPSTSARGSFSSPWTRSPASSSVLNDTATFAGIKQASPTKLARLFASGQTDSLDYIRQVRSAYKDDPEVYDAFLDIMRAKARETVSPAGLMRLVQDLFQENDDLIEGFAALLPEDYESDGVEKAKSESGAASSDATGAAAHGSTSPWVSRMSHVFFGLDSLVCTPSCSLLLTKTPPRSGRAWCWLAQVVRNGVAENARSKALQVSSRMCVFFLHLDRPDSMLFVLYSLLQAS